MVLLGFQASQEFHVNPSPAVLFKFKCGPYPDHNQTVWDSNFNPLQDDILRTMTQQDYNEEPSTIKMFWD